MSVYLLDGYAEDYQDQKCWRGLCARPALHDGPCVDLRGEVLAERPVVTDLPLDNYCVEAEVQS